VSCKTENAFVASHRNISYVQTLLSIYILRLPITMHDMCYLVSFKYHSFIIHVVHLVDWISIVLPLTCQRLLSGVQRPRDRAKSATRTL